jgi:tRNA(Ile)-lysidine synthase
MESDHANLLLARLGQRLVDQMAGQLLAPVLRFHIHVQQVATLVLAGIERVRRPIEHDHSCAGDDLAAFRGQPAAVSSVRQPGFDPGLKVLRHHVENPVVLPSSVDEHPATVVGDDSRVCGRRWSYLVHARSIAFPLLGDTIRPAMQAAPPILRTDLFHPGQRIAIAVSGGADSVALFVRALEERNNSGIVLSVVHVNHGIRGAAAAADAAFVAGLASANGLDFHLHHTDAPAVAADLHETLEEAARNLRYAFFRELLATGRADAVATAHTLDDQAETVLLKLIRGAWTEGLSGIHPVLAERSGNILRPFLDNTRATVEAWLVERQQPWREDATNQDPVHTRNRIRAQLLPLLRTFNPQIAKQLARLATIAADEEGYWQGELGRLLPSLLLPGRPTRGGGRSSSTNPGEETVAVEQTRLRELPPAVARRVLRAAAGRLGASLSFEHTEQLMQGGKFDLPGGIKAERSLREIRLTRNAQPVLAAPAYSFAVPGEVRAPEYGLYLRAEGVASTAVLRPWKAGDRVTLRYSRGPKKVAEILDRLHVVGDARKNWPVVESEGKIVWMRGAVIESPGVQFTEG